MIDAIHHEIIILLLYFENRFLAKGMKGKDFTFSPNYATNENLRGHTNLYNLYKGVSPTKMKFYL